MTTLESVKPTTSRPGVFEVSAEMKKPLEKKIEFSFGTSRDRMIKMHIERIRSQSIANPVPAPGHTGDISRNIDNVRNQSARYSIGKKIDAFQMRLNKVAQIPGPGKYNTGDGLTGSDARGLSDSRRPRAAVVRFGTA